MPSEFADRTPPAVPGPVRRGWGWVAAMAALVLVPFALVSFFPLVLVGIGTREGAPVWGVGGGLLLLALIALAGGLVRQLARREPTTERRLGLIVGLGVVAWTAGVLVQPYL